MKLGHIGLPVADIDLSKTFYDSISQSVGQKLISTHKDFVGYGAGDTYEFYIHTGKPAISGLHLCFEVATRVDVESFYREGLTHGGSDNGAPGVRAEYGPTYYAAFLIDPNGNNIEAVCRG